LVMYERTESGWRRSQLTGGQSERRVEAFIAPAVSRSKARTASRAETSGFDVVSSVGE
jgi:hypothetical protein